MQIIRERTSVLGMEPLVAKEKLLKLPWVEHYRKTTPGWRNVVNLGVS